MSIRRKKNKLSLQPPQIQFRSAYLDIELKKRCRSRRVLSAKAKHYLEQYIRALNDEHAELKKLFTAREIAQVSDIAQPDHALLWAQLDEVGAPAELISRIRELRPLQRLALIDLASIS